MVSDYKKIASLKEIGFDGFISVNKLWLDNSALPKVKGVYLVLNPDFKNPSYIVPGVGGFFKGKDPNVSLEELSLNQVDGSQVVYIGKAGSPEGKATLYSRLGQYLKFGMGKNIGHWGGRLIWQIKNHKDLVICWKITPKEDPREVEKALIKDFESQFGKLPFANLNR